jgi:hypothetical protein
MPQVERDFPLGHPAAVDTVIGSPEHKEWLRQHEFLENKRDFPPGHPKAADTPGNLNHVPVVAGVDPNNPHLEAFTGRTPEKAAAVRAHNAAAAAAAKESAALEPVDANVANAALAAKRKELGVDALTMEQHMEVLRGLQNT